MSVCKMQSALHGLQWHLDTIDICFIVRLAGEVYKLIGGREDRFI
jgi:hypothetical protein